MERNRILSPFDWTKLFNALPEYLKPICRLAYLVPTRKRELQCLRTDWMDLFNQKLWLPGEHTKSGDPRYLPIPEEMREYFTNIPRESDYVFYRKSEGLCQPLRSLRTDDGALGGAIQKAGIKDFRFNDFRHTAATNLRKIGIRIEIIMAIGGWKTMPTFFRYSNYSDDELLAPYRIKLSTNEKKRSRVVEIARKSGVAKIPKVSFQFS